MIVFTDHALKKIAQRNLKKAWIQETLKHPESVLASYGNREIAYKKIVKFYLAVVFVREENNMVVLTAHWDKSFKPKRKEIL